MSAVSLGGKLLSTTGMLAVGDAVAFAMCPREQVQVWSHRRAPRWYRRMTGAALAHRGRAFAIAGIELLVGLGFIFAAHELVRRRG